MSYIEGHPEQNAASTFLRELLLEPPLGIEVSEDEVTLGRAFFLDHVAQIMQGLLHYSLAGGFARSVMSPPAASQQFDLHMPLKQRSDCKDSAVGLVPSLKPRRGLRVSSNQGSHVFAALRNIPIRLGRNGMPSSSSGIPAGTKDLQRHPEASEGRGPRDKSSSLSGGRRVESFY